MGSERITLLSKRELDKMRQAGQVAAELLNYLDTLVKPGVSTKELNDAAEQWTRDRGRAVPPSAMASHLFQGRSVPVSMK